jgi:hypothetical protein
MESCQINPMTARPNTFGMVRYKHNETHIKIPVSPQEYSKQGYTHSPLIRKVTRNFTNSGCYAIEALEVLPKPLLNRKPLKRPNL